ncbi:ABC transporter ATP-binding protein [Thaumasiovibrio subtropicus]|uniref:ABC transporter ATP-binding protein n=1 Tax=Thaumasiovibrio subtropicus TaxID=1891207 RepID=UPI000B351058|nr:ABC transporter ATP-binding protein [Thaumasiovibrio subtropicus]
MGKLQFLLMHSGAKSRTFWIGILGKMSVEALPAFGWLLVIAYFVFDLAIAWPYMILGALSVVFLQWWVGQTAKQSFLGAYEITHRLRGQLLTDVRRQPLATLTGKGLGEKMKLITSDLKQFEDIFSHLVADVVATLVMPALLLIGLAILAPLAACLMLFFILIACGVLLVAEKRFSQRATGYQQSQVKTANKILEYVACLPMLKTFGRSDRLSIPLCDEIENLRRNGLGLEWAGGAGVVAATLVLELSIPIVAGVTSLSVVDGTLAIGTWLVVVMASVACVRPFSRMAIYAALLRYMTKAAFRLYVLARAPQQSQHGESPHAFDLEVESLTHGFDGEHVLAGIDLSIAEGERVAIVGRSGSGKSTLLNLIAAFYMPTDGEIRIGGKNLSEVGTERWYQHLSYVTQDVQLFSGSLHENLLIAAPKASQYLLDQAISLAGLEDLLARLPKGMDTELGENGCQLSGGERQRVSIARAFLHDTPILLLDEFTSALDSDKQAQIMRSLNLLSEGKTVIMVAHRLNTVVDADRIIVLDKGRIVASGDHVALMESCEHYQSLWRASQLI